MTAANKLPQSPLSKVRVSIGKKILVGIVASMFIVSGLVGLSIYNIGKVYSLTNVVINKNYKAIRSAKIIAKLLVGMAEKEEQILYVESFALKENSPLKKIFRNNQKEVTKHIETLTLILKDPKEKQQLRVIKENFPIMCANFYRKVDRLKTRRIKEEDSKKSLRRQLIKNYTMQKAAKIIIKINDENMEKKLRELKEIEENTKTIEYLVSFLTLLFFLVFGYFLNSSITEPIKKLKAGTNTLSEGNLGKQIDISSGDEFEELAHAFNLMSKELKRLDEMKSEFISIVTHELKTPLTSMKEATNLIQEKMLGPITEEQEHFLNINREGIERLLLFINELLDLSKMEGGLFALSKSKESIEKIIKENLLHLNGLLQEKRIKVIEKIPKDLPLVELDHMMISRVLTNLIGNAIKYSAENAELLISVKNIKNGKNISFEEMFGSIQKGVNAIEVAIEDSGIGIERKNLKDIFSKFHQVKRTEEQNADGVGLGLPIAREIILAHEGTIGAKSTVGKGTCFYFAIPV